MANFEHKEIFSDQKSQFCYFKADLSENFRRCSSNSKDCHWLGLQSQCDHLMVNFEHKEIFPGQKVSFVLKGPINLKISEDVRLTTRIKIN